MLQTQALMEMTEEALQLAIQADDLILYLVGVRAEGVPHGVQRGKGKAQQVGTSLLTELLGINGREGEFGCVFVPERSREEVDDPIGGDGNRVIENGVGFTFEMTFPDTEVVELVFFRGEKPLPNPMGIGLGQTPLVEPINPGGEVGQIVGAGDESGGGSVVPVGGGRLFSRGKNRTAILEGEGLWDVAYLVEDTAAPSGRRITDLFFPPGGPSAPFSPSPRRR
jgi:hypothetical protein